MLLISLVNIDGKRNMMLFMREIIAEPTVSFNLPNKGTVNRYFGKSLDMLEKLITDKGSLLTHQYKIDMYFIDGLTMAKISKDIISDVTYIGHSTSKLGIKTKYSSRKEIVTKERTGDFLGCQYNDMGAHNFKFVYTDDTIVSKRLMCLANKNGIVFKITKDGYDLLNNSSYGYAERPNKYGGIFLERILPI